MAYLVIIIVVALAGITKITLQQRREHKLHIQNDYRTSLEKVATQPLARADDGPRRRWELAGFSERIKAHEERSTGRAGNSNGHSNGSRSARTNGSSPQTNGHRSERDNGAGRETSPRESRKPAAKRPKDRSRMKTARSEAQRIRKERAARAHARKRERIEKHRLRREAERYDDVDWFEDLRAQPSDIHLEYDKAPSRLPRSPRKGGQPSTRGHLDTNVHANIHPAHLPPPQPAEHDLDIGWQSARVHASA